ncbi:hypothetical protein OK349_17325 [Sphingomonas sp. BT-65]|uniref:hypothetical protein n=1 Tax=Sphingomonas sp. BT-65 TaxID=2989821 RepID=UPI00223620BA|nr:hypothetical protein [Sphingomonas sp. BT-65]MCW4463472.1 hypothetical protein [Sphingomonas sp. BT-65]
MRLAKMMTAIAACSLAVSPAIASSAASKLSLSNVRASTDAGRSSEAAGGFLIPLIAVVAVIGGIIVLVDDDDSPDSP